MKKQLLAAAVASTLSFHTFAEDFQFETEFLYVDPEDEQGLDISAYGLAGRIFFSQVDTSKGPLAEAAFLDRSSSIGLSYVRAEAEVDIPPLGTFDVEVDTKAIDTRIVFGGDWLVEASYFDVEDSFSQLAVGVGKYLTPNADLVFTYQRDEEDADEFGDDFEVDNYSLAAHGVNELGGDSAISYDAGFTIVDFDGGSATQLNGGATYFFNNAFGLGAALSYEDSDFVDTTDITLGATWFFLSKAYAELEYSRSNSDFDDGDSDSSYIWSFGVGLRF